MKYHKQKLKVKCQLKISAKYIKWLMFILYKALPPNKTQT